MPTIWINTGEFSGDMQASALLRALKKRNPDIRAVGMGGPNLSGAGQKNLLDIKDLSVMGIFEILTVLPRVLGLLRRIRKEMTKIRPDCVVLVDAPEFNFRVAKIAHSLNIPVYYFIPPKIWAWRTGRVRFLQKYIRHIFCILPFEHDFYTKHGINVDYVGNPLVEMVDWPNISGIQPAPGRIGLMPGSRRKEIESLFPLFGEVARRLLAQGRQLSFLCLRAPNITEARLRELWPSDVPITFMDPTRRYHTMRECQCILAASGTAVLETALAGVPTVITYKASPLSVPILRHLIKVRWVGLPNLIMNREIFPELLQDRATPELISQQMARWLDNPEERQAVIAETDELRRRCGKPGSADRAAARLLEEMAAAI